MKAKCWTLKPVSWVYTLKVIDEELTKQVLLTRNMKNPNSKLFKTCSAGSFWFFFATAVAAQGVNPFAVDANSVPQQVSSSSDGSLSGIKTAPPPGDATNSAVIPATKGVADGLGSMPNPGITLKFDNADIYDVLKVVLGDALNLDYVVDPSVQGRITLKSTTAVNLGDVFSILETALAMSNFAIVKQDKIYKITRDLSAVRDRLPSTGTGPASMVMQIIPTKFVQSSQLANTLRNFLGPQSIVANDPTNRYLIVADRFSNIEKIVEMVATLDVDYLQKVQIKIVPLNYAEAIDVVKELDAIFKTSGLFNWGGTDGIKVYFLPITRMNAVLVAGANDKLLATAEYWIKNLDSEPKNGIESFVNIYSVKNGNAAHLSEILRQLFGSTGTSASGATRTSNIGLGMGPTSSPSTGGSPASSQVAVSSTQPAPTAVISKGNVPSDVTVIAAANGLSGSVLVIADDVTNTLIIKATARDYQQIKKILDRIDTVSRQVLIQVLVAEVALNDTLQYGVEWWLTDTLRYRGKQWDAIGGVSGGVTPTLYPGVVSGAKSGLSYSVFNTAGQIIGLLNLLSQDTNVNVLSTPHVMASDGKTARIEVGDEVAVVTQTSSTPNALGGTSISNSVTYRPTGIILEVTPVISASGRVTLSVSQEVSNVQPIGSTVGGITYPNFSKRKVSTEVVVEDGKPMLIAGLIRDTGNSSVSGIPVMKDVPLFGGLFGSTRKVHEKTELIMSITSFIINDNSEADRITAQFKDALKDLRPLLKSDSEFLGKNLDSWNRDELSQ